MRPTLTPYFPIGGTRDPYAEQGDAIRWMMPGSPHSLYMAGKGFVNVRPNRALWSGAAGLNRKDWHYIWRFGATAVAIELAKLPVKDRNVITLSHGLQVIAKVAALHTLELNSLISLMGPVRADMEESYLLLAEQTGHWEHVYAKGILNFDYMQLLGAVMDTGLRFRRTVRIVGIPETGLTRVGHSGVVRHPDKFDRLDDVLTRFAPRVS